MEDVIDIVEEEATEDIYVWCCSGELNAATSQAGFSASPGNAQSGCFLADSGEYYPGLR
jgi:hypothetical protein